MLRAVDRLACGQDRDLHLVPVELVLAAVVNTTSLAQAVRDVRLLEGHVGTQG